MPNGVHARPASLLEEVSRSFDSEVLLINQRTGCAANAKSVLAIISADIRHNDSCVLTANGADEREAMAAMASFVDDALPHCDDTLSSIPAPGGESHLPSILRGTGVEVHHGTPVVPGVAQGRLVHVGGFKIPPSLPLNGVADSDAEWRTLDGALQKLVALYDRRLGAAKAKIEIEFSRIQAQLHTL